MSKSVGNASKNQNKKIKRFTKNIKSVETMGNWNRRQSGNSGGGNDGQKNQELVVTNPEISHSSKSKNLSVTPMILPERMVTPSKRFKKPQSSRCRRLLMLQD